MGGKPMGHIVAMVRRAFVSALRAAGRARQWKLLAVAPALLLLPAAAPPPPATGRFLALSDVHFDPFADPAIVPKLIAAEAGRWPAIFAASRRTQPAGAGSDTNYALLDSTLKAAAAAGGREGYDFVLLTGDLLRHDFEETFAKYGGGDKAAMSAFAVKTLTFVNREMERRFRGAPLIEALGNNDNDCGDYQPRPGAPLLAATAASLPALAGDAQALADFAAGGNYALAHPRTPAHLFLVLDSVFWSPRYRDACGTSGVEAGSAQLAWLEWQLFRARQRRQTVSLVMHIPPGINPHESTPAAPVRFWVDGWRDRFLAIAAAYAPVLTAGYAGHTHMDDFRILSTPAGPYLAIRVTPSVTPLFGNNPSFSVMRYGRGDARPVGYVSYVFQGGAWQREYDFAETYGYATYSAANLTALAAAIRAGGSARAAYARYYTSGAKSPITDANARVYACAQTELVAEAFAACAGAAAPAGR
jgi:sphingomyelin phosphodiesterase acid-like 3